MSVKVVFCQIQIFDKVVLRNNHSSDKVVLQKILSAPQRLGEDASPEAYLAAALPEAARRKPRNPSRKSGLKLYQVPAVQKLAESL